MSNTSENETAEATIAELSKLLLSETSLSELLQKVAITARQAVLGSDHVGITLMGDGNHKYATAAATDDVTLQLDSQQYETDSGPCLESLRSCEVIRIKDLETDDRFPGFKAGALALGLRGSLSTPLVAAGKCVGALNLYAEAPNTFDEKAEAAAAALAEEAAVLLVNSRTHDEMLKLINQLNEALERRGVIERAKGILMVQQSVTADTAFDILRKASQKANKPLYDVAFQLGVEVENKA